MKKLFVLTLSLFIFIIITSCDDSNPVEIEEKPEFYLTFAQDKSGENNNILVTFITNDWESSPTIIVNGYSMDSESFTYPPRDGDGRYLQGQKVLPYSKVCRYAVTVEGKTTSGSIDMPSLPYSVFCNEVELEIDLSNTISFTDSLKFSWSCDSSSGEQSYLYNDKRYNSSFSSNSVTYLIEDSTNCTFTLKSAYSSHYSTDAKPDVIEYYDNAFIFSESYYMRYNISFRM